MQSWMDIGEQAFANTGADVHFSQLPPVLFGAEWIKTPGHNTPQGANCNVYYKRGM